MAKNNNLGDFLSDIANSLRGKGYTGTINAQDFAAKIDNLPNKWETLPQISKENQTYGWIWNDTEAGLCPENSKTIHGSDLHSSFAYGKLFFNLTTACDIKIDFYQNSEKNYDYLILSNINQELAKSTTADSTYAYRTYGLDGSGSYTYSNVTAGDKYITIKYRKDGSGSTGKDYCKINKITITPVDSNSKFALAVGNKTSAIQEVSVASTLYSYITNSAYENVPFKYTGTTTTYLSITFTNGNIYMYQA